MNYLYIKVIAIALLASIFNGCATTTDSEIEQSDKQEAVNTSETKSNIIEQIDSMDSEKLRELQTEIELELSRRIPVQRLEQNYTEQASPASTVKLRDLEDTPSPNKEMVVNLKKLGVFDNLEWDFNLLEPISRGQFLALLYYANNTLRDSDDHVRLAPSHRTLFTDIDKSHPMYKYVQAFDNAGFSVGYTDKTFQPDRAITREEIIGIKLAVDEGTPGDYYYKYAKNNPWKFNDFEQVDSKFAPYINRDRSSGYPNITRAFGRLKTFKPKQEVYGYEAAGMVSQFGRENAEKALKNLK